MLNYHLFSSLYILLLFLPLLLALPLPLISATVILTLLPFHGATGTRSYARVC